MIETLTFMYNEEFLAPFYLRHYEQFVDKMTIVYDMDSTDKTLEIIKKHPKVKVIEYSFKDMMDDKEKVGLINMLYRTKTDGYILNVDADEFIFPGEWRLGDVTTATLYNVYRHKLDKDLDINKPIAQQRRHGYLNPMYVKPIIVKTGLKLNWLPGNHQLEGYSGKVLNTGIIGAHWANADPCFCVERRVKNRRDRQSKYNLDNRLTVQHHGIIEQDVLNECKYHEEDEQCW